MIDGLPHRGLRKGWPMLAIGASLGLGANAANAQLTDPPAPPAPVAIDRTAVTGQRAAENALRAADDGFGTRIGRESVGIYKTTKVRGFSPIDAGNIRIDGLYFDQAWPIGSHLLEATNIRVGIATLGLPFPSPTGIVDYRLRKPGDELAASLLAAADAWGTVSFEGDISAPIIADRLSVAGGVTINHFNDYNGTRTRSSELSAALRWTPTANIEITPFWSRERQNAQDGVLYLPAGDYLPPPVTRRRFLGPDWARFEGSFTNYGVLATVRPGKGWTLRAGLFRSVIDSHQEFSNLLVDLLPDGRGDQLIIADPPSRSASTSGELRLSRSVSEGPRRHQLHFSLRGRAGDRSFDGSDYADLGTTVVDGIVTAPKPAFLFTEQQQDRVRQWTAGIAYEGRWAGIGELGIGVSRTDYRKRIGLPGLPPVSTDASPWLFNVNVTAQVAHGLVAYAGYVTGLEESGVAPANASNRNEPLPAISTSQRDAGLRWSITPKLALIAGVFDVRKPYYNLAADGRFALLGNVVNRGIEVSMAGAVTPRLNIVAGAVLLRPQVTGEAVTRGIVGARPVGAISQRVQGNIDWRLPFLDGVSVDSRIAYQSAQTATVDNNVRVPARTIVDVGGRYRFTLAGKDATLRLVVANIFDKRGFDAKGAGVYDIIPRRLASGYLTIDF